MENIIVRSSGWNEQDIKTLFGDEEVHFTDTSDISSLLKELDVVKSTSEARRNGRHGPIPKGWTGGYKASKKHRLWIWNPTE